MFEFVRNAKTRNSYGLSAFFMSALCLLAGCGAGSAGAEPSESSKTVEKTVLTYMVPGYGGEGYLGKSTVEKINETFPDIEIQVEQYAEDQYYAVLNTRLATGKGPDLFFIQPEYAGANGLESLAAAGYLAPVTDLACIQNADEAKFSLLRRGDEVYSVSVGKMAVGLLYNKTLFAENGLKFPGCWEDFLACCESLKEKGIQPLTLGAQQKNGYQLGVYQIAANLLYPKEPDYDKKLREGEKKFTDSDGWGRVFETYMDLYEKGYMDAESTRLTVGESTDKLRTREAAMIFTSSMQAGALLREEGQDEFAFTTLPVNGRGESTYWSMGEIGGIGLYKGTEYPQACKAVLEEFWNYVADPDSEGSGSLPGEAQEAYQAGRYFHLCNQGWQNEVEVVMEMKLQEYIMGGKIRIRDITEAMQEELER